MGPLADVPFDARGEDPSIVLDSCGKRFGEVAALEEISLAMPRSAILAVVGPNGAGKTTLLRLIAGLERPSRGRITILGQDVGLATRSMCGYVSDDAFVYEHLTGREHLSFVAALRRTPRPQVESSVSRCLERLGLLEHQHKLAATYSRGMRQRLALASLCVHDPPVLLLDEPFTGLDVESVALAARWIRDYAMTRQGTVLLATHDADIVRQLCDGWILLDKGRLRSFEYRQRRSTATTSEKG